MEWAEGHIEGAVLMPLHSVPGRLNELDGQRPAAVHCKGGYRSTIAASLFQRGGFQQVFNVIGGFDGWCACNLPYVRAQQAAG
jgi:rhodanese-related sulfurtransferase